MTSPMFDFIEHRLGWNREGLVILFLISLSFTILGFSSFFGLLAYFIFWVENFWLGRSILRVDWLFVIIWVLMYRLIKHKSALWRDIPLFIIGLSAGFIVEAFGTQTELWTYYTGQRPPLWIIPSWPVAGIAIDHLVRIVNPKLPDLPKPVYLVLYWLLLPGFYLLMFLFVQHTLSEPFTIFALVTAALFILFPKDYRMAVISFLVGSGFGFFLELWGTTRLCWTYHTGETPPVFAVFAHGFVAMAIWRLSNLLHYVLHKLGITWFQELAIKNRNRHVQPD